MTENLFEKIRAMPKIELHRHLEGAIRLETLIDIAREYDVEMPEYEVDTLRPFVQMMPDEPRTWQNFLAKFKVLRQFFLSPDVIRRITREVIIDAANDNVKYLELRFTPKALCNLCECSPHQAVTWVCDTASATAEEYDIDVRLIVSMNRHESVEIGEAAAQAAIDHRHLGVVGIDLAGMEPGNPTYPFRHIFKEAKAAGLGITLHAGEWEGAQSIWDAISNIGGDRIGHGIRILEDYNLVNVLLERGVVLEVCPSSNVDTGVVNDLESHPLPRLIANGLKVTLNTDDPLVSNITLTDEICRVLEHTPLDIGAIKQMTMAAANAAFLPPDEKTQLVNKFQKWLFDENSEG